MAIARPDGSKSCVTLGELPRHMTSFRSSDGHLQKKRNDPVLSTMTKVELEGTNSDESKHRRSTLVDHNN